MSTETIGKRIQRLRKAQGLTQEQLSEQVGVSPQAVSKWENDNSCPDIAILPQLARVLGVSTDSLLGGSASSPESAGESADTAANVTPPPFSDAPVDKDEDEDEDRDDDSDVHFVIFSGTSSKRFTICLSLFAIVFGVLLLIHNVSDLLVNVGFWSVIWPVALIMLVGFPCTFQRRPSVFGVGMLLLGTHALLSNLEVLPFTLEWWAFLAIIIIYCGVSALIGAIFGKKKCRKCSGKGSGGNARSVFTQEHGFLKMQCKFGDFSRKIDSQRITGADVEVSFGDVQLDLTPLTGVSHGAVLKSEVSFGDLTVYLPRTVRIVNQSESSFGDFSISGVPNADAPYELVVNARISFGDMTIEYR